MMAVAPGEGSRMLDLRRREFVALLGSAAVAWPVAVRAQQAAMPVIGFMRSTTLAPFESLADAFRQGLNETGFVEGRNVAVEYRYGDNQEDRLPILVAELTRRPVAVLVTNNASALAAIPITTTIPIVFVTGGDPVKDGLVSSLNRPGGNVTGVVFFSSALGAKRLDLLRQLVPQGATIAVLVNPTLPNTEAEYREVQAAAQAIGQQLAVVEVRNDRDVEAAFPLFLQRGAAALFVGAGPFFNARREHVVALADRHRLPASYGLREHAVDGGLMSYGASQSEAYRQAGIYAGRILKGEKPGDLPVIRSTKLQFVINLKTAKTLRLEIPPTLLALADEVIE
jgi:putative tryptophan/tyrosine transport system substrate-binding protein